MAKKKLNETEILLVIVCNSKEEMDSQLKLISENGLNIPAGYESLMHFVIGKRNLATAFNEVQKKYNSKFKFYITEPIAFISQNLIMKMLEAFYMEPKTALVGLLGSEMPIEGDYTQAKNFYGCYNYVGANNEVQNYVGTDPFLYKSVHIVESGFFGTCEDIAWDERIGDEFIVTAHCCNLRNKGYDIGVMYQEKIMLLFKQDECSYNFKPNIVEYNKQLEKFRNLYRKKFQPLVSVLIPTYNQPKFCCEALESALNQTYQNIEILIGDDSTNEDTKKAIKPYLKKYPNVKYFYHNGAITRGGGPNMTYLLAHCHGEYINYLMHDDLFYPEKISKMMSYYINDLEDRIALVTSSRDKVDENGKFIKRQNNWKPHADTVIKGEEAGRRILFVLANLIGELSTALFKKGKPDSISLYGEDGYCIGKFFNIGSRTYGDLDTWLNLLRRGDLVFISESLSAFRKHEAQNTYNPNTRINLPLDALMFVIIAWLNDVFFKDVDEFNYCLDKWPVMASMWFKPIQEDDSEKVKFFKEWLIKLRDVFSTGNHDKMLDISIQFLLGYLLNENPIHNLVRKNEYTGLWEKNAPTSFYDKDFDLCGNMWRFSDKSITSKVNNKSLDAFQFNGFSHIRTQEYFEFMSDKWTVDFKLKISDFFTLEPIFYSTIFSFSATYLVSNLFQLSFNPFGFEILGYFNEDFNYKYPFNLEKDTWYHVEVSHDEDNLLFFVDGILIASEPFNIDLGKMAWSYIGSSRYANRFLKGYVDEFRISIGTCRHTENFTPPTEPYELDEFTKCLLRFNKDKN